jgi:uncharacterized protein
MIIKIANLSLGEYEFSFTEKIEDIDLNKPFLGNVKTNVKLTKLSDQLFTQISSTLLAEFECDRCTTIFQKEIISEYQMIYLINNFIKESNDTNITYITKETDKIDIKNDVREFAILSIPMKKLCNVNCKGLCPGCGVDLNYEECKCQKNSINPIWLPLLEQKIKVKK